MKKIIYAAVVISGVLYLDILHAMQAISTLEGVSIFASKALSYPASRGDERKSFILETIDATAECKDNTKEMRVAILDKIEVEMSDKIPFITDLTRSKIKTILGNSVYTEQQEMLGKALLSANSVDKTIVSNYDLDSILRAINFIGFSSNTDAAKNIQDTFFPLLRKAGLGGYLASREEHNFVQ